MYERMPGLLGASGDVVILLVLAAAVASPRVLRLARPLLAISAFTCAWLLTAMSDALQAPGWTMFTDGVVIVISIVVVTATVHLWTQQGDGSESGAGLRGNDGGGGPRRRRPDAPQRGDGGNDPSWWPEFERQLALYIAERERETEAPATLPRQSVPKPSHTRDRGTAPVELEKTPGRTDIRPTGVWTRRRPPERATAEESPHWGGECGASIEEAARWLRSVPQAASRECHDRHSECKSA
jgi:hypothetical protein